MLLKKARVRISDSASTQDARCMRVLIKNAKKLVLPIPPTARSLSEITMMRKYEIFLFSCEDFQYARTVERLRKTDKSAIAMFTTKQAI